MKQANKRRLLIYLGHPAQYLFIKNTLKAFITDGSVDFRVVIKSKDVLENLLQADEIPYINILPKKRGNSKFSIALSVLIRINKVLRIALSYKPDLFWGGDPSIAVAAKILRKDCVIVLEDDYSEIYQLARLTFPLAKVILCPTVCDVGPYRHKKIGYEGYMKLAYLHPSVFTQVPEIARKYTGNGQYALLRLSELKAYHDIGIGGITEDLLDQILDLVKLNGLKPFISAEGTISPKYQEYCLSPRPEDMAHLLAGASLFISDSQSMSVEAAMLGVPSVRYNGFVGRISVLEELHHKYELTFGVHNSDPAALIKNVREILMMSDRKTIFELRKQKMLAEKINVSEFITRFLREYPAGLQLLQHSLD